MRSGITKVVPPPEWTGSLPPMDRRTLSKVEIRRPIQQNMMGTAGIYRATNIEKNKSRALSVKEWFDKCQDDKFAGPGPKSFERDSKEAKEAHEEAKRDRIEREAKKKEEWKRKREEKAAERRILQAAREAEGEMVVEEKVDMTAIVNGAGERPGDGHDHGEEKTDVPPLDPPSSGSSRSSEPAKTPELDPIDPWYDSVDLKTAWLPRHTNEEDYTDEACAKLQEKYWKSMGLGEPSWYGADLMQGTSHAATIEMCIWLTFRIPLC